MKLIHLILFAILTTLLWLPELKAQNVNYQLRIAELKARADNDPLEAGQQDPIWHVWVKDNGTTPGTLNAWQTTGCIYVENSAAYDLWWSGTTNEGPDIPYDWFVGANTILNTDATQLQTEMEGFEKDGFLCSGGNCDYVPTNIGVWPWDPAFCAEGDENFDSRASSGNIDFKDDPPCQWNQYEINRGDYFARIEIYWEYVTVDPGTIDGDQSVCPGSNPTTLGSVSSGTAGTSPHLTYQWQQDIGCFGSFIDIFGANLATYTPLPSASQDICYRRSSVSASCPTVYTNTVTVAIDIPSSTASSIVANPTSICGTGTSTLYVSGGALGTGANWTWYNGDPNFGGTLLGTGDPFLLSASTTTHVFLRAEGNCDTTNTVSQIVTIESPTSSPTAVTATSTTICQGDNVDLSVSGGGLGTSGLWTWYTSDPTATVLTPVFSSTTTLYPGVSPLFTTTYYVRAEGCDTSNVAAITITVNTNSNDASAINASNPTVCSGSPSTLTVSGGSLGTGADWYWYSGGCGAGSPIGSGNSIIVNPASTTTYFVRAEGTCNTTNCASITILVEDLSSDPITVVSSVSSVCPGGLSVLSVAGGSLGAGADWYWYSGACGGVPLGNGPTLAVNPLVTTDYYVRAEGTCNTTVCATTTITVDDLSVAAGSISASFSSICPGGSATLDVSGGSLGPGANWEWYSNSCGGIYIGSGTTVVVNPSTTTTYYVRAEGPCNTTTCISTTIIVDPVSSAATFVNATSLSVCPGSSTTLSTSGGSLAPGDNWYWYEGGCGFGTTIGTGASITVSPSTNTTYFVRAEGTCSLTPCASVTINMDVISTDPTSIVATSTSICLGQSSALSVSGGALGTGATWEWYSGSCGGAYLGSGNSISVSPSATTTYFARAEGDCGNSNCAQITITVGAGVPDPTAANVTTNDICPNETTTLYVTGPALPSAYSWVWYTGACGAVPVGIGDSLNVSPSDTTTYYVAAVGTCGMTLCESITVNVSDGSLPADGAIASNNGFCPGETATLTAVGGYLSTGSVWTWYENSCAGSAIGTGSSINISPSATTTYFVGAEGGTCGNTACVSIQVSVLDNYVYLLPFEELCGMAAPIELLNGIPSGGTYSGTGVVGDYFDPTIAGSGSHPITYSYTSADGCTNSVTESINIVPSDLTVEIGVEQLPCAEGGVVLDAEVSGGSGYYDYYWSDGEVGNPRYFVQEGTYYIVIQDADDCQAISDPIEVTDEMSCIEIPNTITPNDDGKNDTWNLNLTQYANAQIKVFSRWGRIVMTSTDLQINWDGTSMSGQSLPAGTYYYVLELNDGSITQNGPIIILR